MTTVKLLKPHTHAGTDYPAGAVIELDKDRADWLISVGVAQTVTPTPTLPRKAGEGASKAKGE